MSLLKIKRERGKDMAIVFVIISFIISAVIVNLLASLFITLIGADAMFFSGKKRLVTILVVTWFVINCLFSR
jgi:hypothetical protein